MYVLSYWLRLFVVVYWLDWHFLPVSPMLWDAGTTEGLMGSL